MRIVIAEDAVLLRAGIERLLAGAGHEVLAAVGEPQALLAAVDRFRPDLAVVDVRMPPTQTDEGVRAAIELRRTHPRTAVLVLSQYVEERYAAELLGDDDRGVGYLLKDRVMDVADFLAAVDRVGTGGVVIDSEVVQQLLGRHRHRRADPIDRLTPRERDVLELMAEGHTNAAIAADLVVTEGAVEKHVRNIFAKLDLTDAETSNRRVLAVLTFLKN